MASFLISGWLVGILLWTNAFASDFLDAMHAYKAKKYQEAKELFESALEEDGAQQAQYFLGLLYLEGKGVKKNLSTAISYLKRAVDVGNARAKCALAKAYLLQKSTRKKRIVTLLQEGKEAGAQECVEIIKQYKMILP